MTHSRTRDAMLAGAVLTVPFLVLTAPAATAHPDAGPSVRAPSLSDTCPLRRVGRQLVRCDRSTGAGVRAATWVPRLGR